MSQPRHRLLLRIAKYSLIAAIALVPVTALAPDSAKKAIVDHGPTAGIVLLIAAGVATLVAHLPRRRQVTVTVTVPAALPPADVAAALPAAPTHTHTNALTVHAVRSGQRRNELATAGQARRELPAAPTGGAR